MYRPPPSVHPQHRWCDHESSAATTEKANAKSTGINPSSFYKQMDNGEQLTISERKLHNILRRAAQNEVVRVRSDYTAAQKLQRAKCSVQKTFPLQSMALDFFSSMMKEYRGVEERTCLSRQPSQHADCTCSVENEDACARDGKRIKLSQRVEANVNDSVEHCAARSPSASENEINQEKATSLLWSTEPRIFSVESSSGTRKYIVGHLGRFLEHYWRDTDPHSRHYYELIRERTPCRLFFDVEFCKSANPHITARDSEALMTQFMKNLCSEIKRTHDIWIDRKHIVDLDSSTENKFSRHLIIHMPGGELFADAWSAGVFVKRFVGRLAEELSTGALASSHGMLAKYLFVNSQAPKSTLPQSLDSEDATQHIAALPPKRRTDYKNLTCFIDLGVYTRNRLFRLMGSTKCGKSSSAALRIASVNEFPFPAGFGNQKIYLTNQTPPDTESRQERTENSCNSDPTCNQQRLPSGVGSKQSRDHDAFRASLDWETHAQALAMTFVVPANVRKNALILTEPDDGKVTVPGTARRLQSSSRNCSGDSPIPKLDQFICELSKRGGIQGKIRAWSIEWFSHEGKLNSYMSYQMSENRFCENIQRPHRSNNIIWNVDLTWKSYWQTCHDPECRAANFRGRALTLPEDVVTDVNDYLLDRELAELDEDKIIREAHKPDFDFSDTEFDARLAEVDMSLLAPRSDSAK